MAQENVLPAQYISQMSLARHLCNTAQLWRDNLHNTNNPKCLCPREIIMAESRPLDLLSGPDAPRDGTARQAAVFGMLVNIVPIWKDIDRAIAPAGEPDFAQITFR
jgi:hypothetical protein